MCGGILPQALAHCYSTKEKLPLLGSNQDSPDPEGLQESPELQQLATLYASSCHAMLEFAGFHAGLCRTLLTEMSEFAAPFL